VGVVFRGHHGLGPLMKRAGGEREFETSVQAEKKDLKDTNLPKTEMLKAES